MKEEVCTLVDAAISGDGNVIKKDVEKILKYKDLAIAIEHTCNVRTRIIPVIRVITVTTVITVITGTSGTISKLF